MSLSKLQKISAQKDLEHGLHVKTGSSNCWVLNLHSTAHLESTSRRWKFTARCCWFPHLHGAVQAGDGSGIQFDMYQYYSNWFWYQHYSIGFLFSREPIYSILLYSKGLIPRVFFADLLNFSKNSQCAKRYGRYLWLWWLWWPESAAQLVGWKVRLLGWQVFFGNHCLHLDMVSTYDGMMFVNSNMYIYIYTQLICICICNTHVLGQWLKFKLFGITYWVGKIKFKDF